jgi:hypothetical protein
MRRTRQASMRAFRIEALEGRLMLSVSAPADADFLLADFGQLTVQPAFELLPSLDGGSSTPGGLSPAQVRGAYGLGPYGASPIIFNGIQGDGSGQTIAIVVAYHHPNALADLQQYSAAFGLPNPPSFNVVNQRGNAAPLPPVEPNPESDFWRTSCWSNATAMRLRTSCSKAPARPRPCRAYPSST